MEEKIKRINSIAMNYYHENLLHIDEVPERIRCLLEAEPNLGYADINGNRLYQILKEKHGFTDDEIISSGLFIKEGAALCQYFKERFMFPLLSNEGECLGFQGLSLSDKEKYINTRETLVFNKSGYLYGLEHIHNTQINEKQKLSSLIVCEGITDVLTLRAKGYHNSIAVLGAQLTFKQALIISLMADTIYLCFDSDKVGFLATISALALLRGFYKGSCRLVSLKPYKDPREFLEALQVVDFEKRLTGAVDGNEIMDGLEKDIEQKFDSLFL